MTASRGNSERLRVGIIGGGAITQVAHLPVLKKMKTIEVRAICDTDLPKARALADRFGVKDAFDDIEELLRYEALDAVVICSPNHLHESHILAALSANLHVLVEKPLAMSAASAQRIVEAAEKHGKVVMVGMNHRYRPDVQIVRSFVQSGELGTVESVRGSWHVFRPGRTQLGWRQRRDQAGGGAMLDLGLSILDLGPLARREPEAQPGERQSRFAGQGSLGRAVRQRVRRLRERHVALRRRHLAPPRRRRAVRRRPPRKQGHRRDQPAERLEGAARRGGGCVADRLGKPGERVHRVLPCRMGSLRGGHRGRGQGTLAPGASRASQDHGRDLQIGGGRQGRERCEVGSGAARWLCCSPEPRHHRRQLNRRTRQPAAPPPGLSPHRLPHDHGARGAGLGAVRA